mmetsp:Transcript_3279/g.11465  ORF Transcript_3279/g.11465 Transcript_3279/m.11465 type:complete len:201 (+) Transcript_3279:2164-2766(+)
MRDGVGRHDPGVAAAALDRQPRCAVLGLLELFRNDPFLHPSHRVHLVKVNLEAAGPRTRRRPRDAPHHQLARPRPAQRPWLAPQDSDLAHLDAGLLHHLPRRGLLQGLALLDEARKASQHPARGVTGRPKQRVVAVRGDHQADGHRVQPRVLRGMKRERVRVSEAQNGRVGSALHFSAVRTAQALTCFLPQLGHSLRVPI